MDEGVRVTPIPGGTELRFDTHQVYGRTLTATLR
jgi:hyaluronate lyase